MPRGRKFDGKDLEYLLKACREGISDSLLAERFGINANTVCRIRKKAGIIRKNKSNKSERFFENFQE